MIVEDQSDLIAFLSRPDAYGGGVGEVERIDTHISAVFLAGDRAYKLKRAVKLPYLDFSTAALRRAACEAELAINRRTAPGLYLGVVAVTRGPAGGLEIGGRGAPVDWLVVMRRFAQEDLFESMAERGVLETAHMTALAEAVANVHRQAEVRGDAGGAGGVRQVIADNARSFAECRAALDQGQTARLAAAAEQALQRVAELLEERRRGGRVRRCHGDLHLRTI